MQRRWKGQSIQLPPALFHHFTTPSSPPVMNAPAEPAAGACGLQETDHTSPVSGMVETAVRAPMSHTLAVLSAELKAKESQQSVLWDEGAIPSTHPESANRPSGEKLEHSTHDEWPTKLATAPDPGFPLGETRTSCRTSRLSSDADSRSCESADHASPRTVIACEVYVVESALDSRSKM